MKILLIPNPNCDRDFSFTQHTADVLIKNGMMPCVLSGTAGDASLPPELHICCEHEMKYDFIVSIGGDGSLLHAARTATRLSIPILGINTGNLGFIVELDSHETDLLSCLGTGMYTIENRMMIDVTVTRAGEEIMNSFGLNDAVITHGELLRTVPLEISTDGIKIYSYSGDGVIVASPTGATAYSLSAGGPVVEPEAECLIVTPVCAHSLYTKPVVLLGTRTVDIVTGTLSGRSAVLTVDGLESIVLQTGDRIRVSKSKNITKLVRIKDAHFFHIFSNKMMQRD